MDAIASEPTAPGKGMDHPKPGPGPGTTAGRHVARLVTGAALWYAGDDMLVEQIKARLKDAMKGRRTVEKEILRVALGDIQTEEARHGKAIADADAEKIVRKLMKSNRETEAMTEDAEQRAILGEETAILESLLPKTLGVDEVVAALAGVQDDIRGAKADGPATGIAMKQLKQAGATVDGKTVAEAVRRIRGA